MPGAPSLLLLLALLCAQSVVGSSLIELPSWRWRGFQEEIVTSRAKADADAIIKAAFSTSKVWDRLAYMTDTFGPRLSGSSGLERSLDWVKEEMEKDGLIVQEEPVKVPCWVRGKEFATLLSPREKNVPMLGLGRSIATPHGKSLIAKVLVVSSFEELEQRNLEVKGRIVLFNVEFQGYGESVIYRTKGAQHAEKYGAVAVLIRSIAPFGLQTPHTGAMSEAGIPAAAITLEDSLMFARMQSRDQEVIMELYMEAHTLPDQFSRNLIVEIEGTETPKELVIIGGHTDSWDIADGAMDDGGGAFVAWEVIRLLHNLGLRPKRTLRAVLFVNEENGSKGAIQYAHNHQHEANLTSLALESDDGTFTPHGISFLGSKAARGILKDIGETLLSGIGSGNVSGDSIGEDISYVVDQGVPGGSLLVLDPRVGHESNNPCLGYSNPPYPEPNSEKQAYFWLHHTSADTVDKLSPKQLSHCAATLAVFSYSVANLNALLPR